MCRRFFDNASGLEGGFLSVLLRASIREHPNSNIKAALMKSSVLNRNLADLPVRPGSLVGAEEEAPALSNVKLTIIISARLMSSRRQPSYVP